MGSPKGLSLVLCRTSQICFRFHLSSENATLFCFCFTFTFTSGPKQLGKVVMSPSRLSINAPRSSLWTEDKSLSSGHCSATPSLFNLSPELCL